MSDIDIFARKTNVSRETLADYQAWHDLLLKWNARINLVAKNEMAQFWHRHALDSWQICRYLPEADAHIVDFGSGGGFPAISAAIHCKHSGTNGSGAGRVTLIESVGKKASFLKTAIRELSLPAEVRGERIENLDPLRADIITARAFAPLPRLLEYAEPHQKPGTDYILLKGASVDEELKAASRTWTFTSEAVTSLTDEAASILLLKDVRRK